MNDKLMPKLHKSEIENLPPRPGCYIFTDSNGKIIYIGKSKNLKKRVKQYFHGKNENDLKIGMIVKSIENIEYILTDTDIEAILLENKLIHRHRPVLNSKMNKDLKPNLLCINTTHERPGVYISKKQDDGDICFRIYRRGWIGGDLPGFFNTVFGTPVCQKRYFKEPFAEPCVQYRKQKCLAPCRSEADIDGYKKMLENVCRFYRDGDDTVPERLQKEMHEQSEQCNFEQAAVLRDQYNYLLNTRRYASGNFDFNNKKVCVFIGSYHEKAFILCYVEDDLVKLQKTFMSPDDFTKSAQKLVAGQIFGKVWDDDVYDAYTILDISAKRFFVDVTNANGVNEMVVEIDRGFSKFALL